jgi:hypothetical protein
VSKKHHNKMQNNFLRISTKSGVTHYVNIAHIVDIHDTPYGSSTFIETINSTIYSDSPIVELVERIYKIQWDGETKNTNNNTK